MIQSDIDPVTAGPTYTQDSTLVITTSADDLALNP